MVFKEEIGPKFWMMEAIVRAVFKRRGGASLGMGRAFKSAANRLEFRFERKLQNRPRSSRDRPRSTTIDHDRASIVLQILRKCCSTVVESIPQQMECDCSSIAPQSRRDPGSIGPRSWVLPRFVVAVRSAIIAMKIRRSRASTWRQVSRPTKH